MNFEATQPDPGIPGGTVREAPPVPNEPERVILAEIDDAGEIIFLELDDGGVPLGAWHWEEEPQEWVFEEYPTPLGAWETSPATDEPLPVTGGTTAITALIIGFTLTAGGALFLKKNRD